MDKLDNIQKSIPDTEINKDILDIANKDSNKPILDMADEISDTKIDINKPPFFGIPYIGFNKPNSDIPDKDKPTLDPDKGTIGKLKKTKNKLINDEKKSVEKTLEPYKSYIMYILLPILAVVSSMILYRMYIVYMSAIQNNRPIPISQTLIPGVIIIIFLIIMLVMMFNDYNITSPGKPSQSQEELVGNIFIILFFSLLVVGICIMFLPSLNEFKQLFQQIGSVTYFIVYTIFAILFYTMVPKDILDKYSYLINPPILGLGAFSLYKGASYDYIERFSINYERIKMLILLFCLITLIITFYNINPGGFTQKYFGYSLLLTIIISVFAFLYLIILLTLPENEGFGEKNFLSNFSSFGSYGTALFLIFLITMTLIIGVNRENLFENKAKVSGIIILMLVICILWSALLGHNLLSGETLTSNINVFKSSLLILFGLVISGLLIFWISYNIESLSGKSGTTSFILNMLLVAVIIGLIYKTIFVKLPVGNTKKNAFFNLIGSIIFYIPCLLSGGFDLIGKLAVGEYNSANAGSFMMLIAAIALFAAYIKGPVLFNYVSTQGGKQLVNRPVYTDMQYNLGGYQELTGSDEFDYQYAISCWVFIDSAGPNMNPNYNKYTSLLNFGNKPNILYNGEKHSLMVTMQQKNLQNITKNRLIDFDDEGNRIIYVNKNILLQKWNNLIINYNGGTLDIFLNGELVSSTIEAIPYYTFDNLMIGENNGIKGGICNVVYFRQALTSQNIYYLYNTVKDRTPPVLNDSDETILVKNVNQAISSAKNNVNI
jgi:hypothetical protein